MSTPIILCIIASLLGGLILALTDIHIAIYRPINDRHGNKRAVHFLFETGSPSTSEIEHEEKP